MEIITSQKENIIFDSQVLTAIQSCARYTEQRFEMNYTNVKSNALECGSLVHTILEWYNRSIVEGKSRNDAIQKGFEQGNIYIHGCPACIAFNTPVEDSLNTTLPTSCPTHKDNDYLGLKETPEENETKAKHGSDRTGWKYVLKTMQEYFDYNTNDAWTPIASEEVRGRIIYEDDELRVLYKAKYDVIYDTPNGIMGKDYKTMKMNKMTSSMNNQFIGQCVLLNTRSVCIDKIGFQTTLPPHEKFPKVIINYSIDRLAEWVNEIIPFYAHQYIAFKKANFWPMNLTSCENKYGYCDFKSVCEIDRNLRPQMLRTNFKVGKKWDI